MFSENGLSSVAELSRQSPAYRRLQQRRTVLVFELASMPADGIHGAVTAG